MRSTTPTRVLFDARAAYGHVYPLLPLATAFHDAGHEVHFATAGEFVDRLARLGFTTHDAGLTVPEAERITLARPELQNLPREEIGRFASVMFGEVLASSTCDALVPLIDAVDPALVVYEEFDPGAALAARARGVPAVAHSLGRQPADFFRMPVIERLAGVWQQRSHLPFVDPFATDPYVDITPPSLRDALENPAVRLYQRPTPRTDEDASLPAWVTQPRARPLAYVTLGTVAFGAVHSLRAVIAGLARLDMDVLVTVGPRGDVASLGSLPASVRAERFVPQDALLPHVDVSVHHCGSGTMLGSLARGIPQLAIPHGADQFMNADALVRSGAGSRLLPEEITPDAVAAHVRGLLSDPTYGAMARRIAGEIAAMPAPDAVVPVLLDYATENARYRVGNRTVA